MAMKGISLVKTEKPLINTFSEEQIRALLTACDRKTFTGLRNYTILLTFLETGIRVSEPCRLKLSEIRFSNSHLHVYEKGRKFRHVPFQRRLSRQLREYINIRGNELSHDFLFVTIDSRPVQRRMISNDVAQQQAKYSIWRTFDGVLIDWMD